jgi:hypothetical protein
MVLLLRSLLRSRAAVRGGPRFFSAAAKSAMEAAKPKGPPFARYFWYTTAIMIGIPGAVGAVFVYNLQTDDEFYSHFNDRYPDLIEAIDAYVPLNESLLELAKREDVGPIGSTEDLINESMWHKLQVLGVYLGTWWILKVMCVKRSRWWQSCSRATRSSLRPLDQPVRRRLKLWRSSRRPSQRATVW